MPGTRDQVKYAMSRIDEIWREKSSIITDECTTPAKIVTAEDFIRLVKEGKVTVKPDWDGDDNVANSYLRLESLFDLSKFQRPAKVDTKRQKDRQGKLHNEVVRIKDQLMLGDLTAALAMIEKLASSKF